MPVPAPQAPGSAEASRTAVSRQARDAGWELTQLRYGRVERNQFTVAQTARSNDGLCDLATGRVYLFDRRIRDTIYGMVLRAVSGVRRDGVVHLDGGHFAIKVFERRLVSQRKARTGQAVQEDPLRELAYQQFLSQPGHDNVLRLHACFQDTQYIYAVLPLAGMELYDLIAMHGPLSEQTARQIFVEMLAAIEYCNSRGVAHRDISPENFLLDTNQGIHPILIDFGLAYMMEPSAAADLDHTAMDLPPRPWRPIPYSMFIGKLLYAAPEMWSNQPYDGPTIDLWSAIVTLFVMVFKSPPWNRARVSQRRDGYVLIVLQSNLPAFLRLYNFNASDLLIDLLQRSLRENPNERLSLAGVRAHPWTSDAHGGGGAPGGGGGASEPDPNRR